MTTTKTRRTKTRGVLVATLVALTAAGELTGTGPLLLGGDEAHAIVGRPLTPVSYAGVARRTTRRAVYAGAATGAYYGGGGYYAAPRAAVVTTVPANCARTVVNNTLVYQCGSAAYQPYYDGPNVVYRSYP